MTTINGQVPPEPATAVTESITLLDVVDDDLTLDAVTATFNELAADQAAFVRAQVAMDAARDKLAHTEQRAHAKMLKVKDSVCSQYGDDSNEYAALGMKKKSEYKKGGGKPKPPEA